MTSPASNAMHSAEAFSRLPIAGGHASNSEIGRAAAASRLSDITAACTPACMIPTPLAWLWLSIHLCPWSAAVLTSVPRLFWLPGNVRSEEPNSRSNRRSTRKCSVQSLLIANVLKQREREHRPRAPAQAFSVAAAHKVQVRANERELRTRCRAVARSHSCASPRSPGCSVDIGLLLLRLHPPAYHLSQCTAQENGSLSCRT